MVLCLEAPRARCEEIRKRLVHRRMILGDYKLLTRGQWVYIPVPEGFRPEADMNMRLVRMRLVRKPVPPVVRLPYEVIGDLCVFKAGKRGIRYSVEARKIKRITPRIRSFYVKSGMVQGVKRVPRLKFVQGEDFPVTEVRENGLRFLVDIRRAYFNPRLSTEHLRVAKMANPSDLVLDMFSGVGPFAITIAKIAGSRVDALDINPHAYSLLLTNVKLNHVETKVRCFNTDAEKFTTNKRYSKIIMNLPFNANRFLEHAASLLQRGGLVHLYIQEGKAPTPVELARYGLKEAGSRRVFEYAPRKWIRRIELFKS
jgi:tRNA (guanine37-N1)-methyltransferase